MMKEYRVERTGVLAAMAKALRMCDSDISDSQETVMATSPEKAMEDLLTEMETEYMYDLQDERIRLWDGDRLVGEHVFTANKVVDQMYNMTEFSYKGVGMRVSYEPVVIVPFKGFPNTPIENVKLFLDGCEEDTIGVWINRFMDDMVLRQRLDQHFCRIRASNLGEYRVRYSSGLEELLFNLAGDTTEWVEAASLEEAMDRALEAISPAREYSMEGQWIEVDDGIGRMRHCFRIQPEFSNIFGEGPEMIGPYVYIHERPDSEDVGCTLKPLAAVVKIFAGEGEKVLCTLNPYWPLKNTLGDILESVA